MNTWFASSVQHSGRKNKYPAVKSALLLLFLVFRWWIVHQKLARELHFSRYIYTYSRRTRSFRIPCIGRIKFVHERNGLRFLKLRWSRALVLFPLRRRKIFFPLEPPFSTCSRAFYGDGWNVGFSWRNAAACGELDRAANEASLRSGHSGWRRV